MKTAPVIRPDGGRNHFLEFPAEPGPVSADQLSDADRQYLQELAAERRFIVDVGTYLGGSAEALLSGMPSDGRLITIDTFQGVKGSPSGTIRRDLMLRYALERLEPFADRLIVMVGDSRACANALPAHSADLVFLDAAHDYQNVKRDIAAWLPIVKPDGLMTGHDFDRLTADPLTLDELKRRSELEWDARSGVHCGVIRAVYESFMHVAQPPETTTSIWVAKPEWKRDGET